MTCGQTEHFTLLHKHRENGQRMVGCTRLWVGLSFLSTGAASLWSASLILSKALLVHRLTGGKLWPGGCFRVITPNAEGLTLHTEM